MKLNEFSEAVTEYFSALPRINVSSFSAHGLHVPVKTRAALARAFRAFCTSSFCSDLNREINSSKNNVRVFLFV